MEPFTENIGKMGKSILSRLDNGTPEQLRRMINRAGKKFPSESEPRQAINQQNQRSNVQIEYHSNGCMHLFYIVCLLIAV